MSLIPKSHVKDRWPDWETYCKAHDTLTPDEALDLAITEATTRFTELLPTVTDSTITDGLQKHLLHLVKKEAFNFLHGDSEFDRTPQIIADYEQSMEMLKKYHSGEMSVPDPDDSEDPQFRMNSKKRDFAPGNWFTDGDHTDRGPNQ